MKKYLFPIFLLVALSIAFLIYTGSQNDSSRYNPNDKFSHNHNSANSSLENKKGVIKNKHSLDIGEFEEEIIGKIARGGEEEFELSKSAKLIQKDLAKLTPCEFIEKYHNYENKSDLFFALNGVEGAGDGLRLFYKKDLNFDQLDRDYNDLDTSAAIDLINIDLKEYLKFPEDFNLKKGSKTYYKAKNVLEHKNSEMLDNSYNKIEQAMSEIDESSNIIYLKLLSYNLTIPKADENQLPKNANTEQYEFYHAKELIEYKANLMIRVRATSINERIKDKLYFMLEESNELELDSLIALEKREIYLSQAKSPTEVALAYKLYEESNNVDYKNILILDKELKKTRPQQHKKFRNYIKLYIDKMIKEKNANYVDEDLYKVLSLFDKRLESISFQDFIADKNYLMDPIYGPGCDDRRYKDICTQFCSNN